MTRKRKHWADRIADDIRDRVREAIPVVGAILRDEVPFGYEPPKPDDEVAAFLQMPEADRIALALALGPEEYEKWSTDMMGKMVTRFGSAAQTLFPLLEGAQMRAAEEQLAGDTGEAATDAARASLLELLGIDPGEMNYGR